MCQRHFSIGKLLSLSFKTKGSEKRQNVVGVEGSDSEFRLPGCLSVSASYYLCGLVPQFPIFTIETIVVPILRVGLKFKLISRYKVLGRVLATQ